MTLTARRLSLPARAIVGFARPVVNRVAPLGRGGLRTVGGGGGERHWRKYRMEVFLYWRQEKRME
jgi:hypothetical protein